METFSALLSICAGNSPVPGEFPAQRPVTRSFDFFFDLRWIKGLYKQSWGWWFETISRPLWRHSNDNMGLLYLMKLLYTHSGPTILNLLNGFHNFCSNNQLIVNETKTKVMCFGKTVKPELYFNNKEIEHVEHYKYLGSIIRSTHRCNQYIYMLKIILIQVIKPAKPCLMSAKRQRLSDRWLRRLGFICLNLKWYCVKMCSLKSNSWHIIIASGEGLTPNRQEAIIWTSDGLVYRCVYASLGLSEWNPR